MQSRNEASLGNGTWRFQREDGDVLGRERPRRAVRLEQAVRPEQAVLAQEPE